MASERREVEITGLRAEPAVMTEEEER